MRQDAERLASASLAHKQVPSILDTSTQIPNIVNGGDTGNSVSFLHLSDEIKNKIITISAAVMLVLAG